MDLAAIWNLVLVCGIYRENVSDERERDRETEIEKERGKEREKEGGRDIDTPIEREKEKEWVSESYMQHKGEKRRDTD